VRLPLTPSQTIGPFYHHALSWPDGHQVVPAGTAGRIWIRGRVFDGAGDAVTDALVETWQSDPDGRFDHPDDPRGPVPGFRGYGRCATDASGAYGILTLKPGRVPTCDGELQAPHLDVSVFSRGLLHRAVTRIYFADEQEANADDPVLWGSVDPSLRQTLIAERSGDGYTFDIHLQGEHETVFFRL
jgi:protocatechuate 3,4-dioxygenase alpha subunit